MKNDPWEGMTIEELAAATTYDQRQEKAGRDGPGMPEDLH
jgi:hypothetical protein